MIESGERTIIVSQPNAYPRADDDLGWDDLDQCAAAYATCGEPSGVEQARRARILVCSARQLGALDKAGRTAEMRRLAPQLARSGQQD